MARLTQRRDVHTDPTVSEICAHLCAEVEKVVRAELAGDKEARKVDAETLRDVRKILARLRIGTTFNPRLIEYALWATNALLLAAVLVLAAYARII